MLNGTAMRHPDYVRSMRETAAILGVSVDTLRRLIARGDGPLVTRLSMRKLGIRDSDREAWLAERAMSLTDQRKIERKMPVTPGNEIVD